MARFLGAWLTLLAVALFAGGAWAQAGGPAPRDGRAAHPARIEVRVLPVAEVFGEVFTLGEIAEIDGFDLDALTALSAVEIGAAPLPGRSLKINARLLRSRLAGAAKKFNFNLTVPADARVMRAAQVVRAERISAAVLAQAERDAKLERGAELQQRIVTSVADVIVPKGEVRLGAVLLGKHLVQGGNRVYRVTAVVDGREAWKASLRVRQKIFQDVVVARRSIRRHQKITAADLTLERKDLTANRGDAYLRRIDKVVGRFAKRPLGKGQPLHTGLIQAPADIAEGGRVTMIYESGSLVLRAPGVALVQGRTGQFIPVRNLHSGKVVYGILQGGEIVKVN